MRQRLSSLSMEIDWPPCDDNFDPASSRSEYLFPPRVLASRTPELLDSCLLDSLLEQSLLGCLTKEPK